jgi:hypothetical protein
MDDERASGVGKGLANAADDAVALVLALAGDREEARGLVDDDVAGGGVDDAEFWHG